MSAQMRWPHIARFLRVDNVTGHVHDDHLTFMGVEDELAPAERAAAHEEWAAFYEWCLEQRAAELAADHVNGTLWPSGRTAWPTPAGEAPRSRVASTPDRVYRWRYAAPI